MRAVSFLLGAGASCEAGLPMAKELTSEVLGRSHGDVLSVLRYVTGALQAAEGRRFRDPLNGIDIERVMTALQLLSQRQQLEISPFVAAWDPTVDQVDRQTYRVSEASRIVDALLHPRYGRVDAGPFVELVEKIAGLPGDSEIFREALKASTASLVQILGSPGDTAYMAPLFDNSRQGPTTVVATLNYDRTVEREGERLNAMVDTGIRSLIQTGRWDFSGGSTAVALLKLHGSIDWAWSDDRTGALIERRIARRTSDHEDPAVIFGGNKLRAEGPFLDLLAQWEFQLRFVDDIIVVGYSFRDDHVNEVVRRWINRTKDPRIVVVDPGFDGSEPAAFASELSLGLRGAPGGPDDPYPETVGREHRILPIRMPASAGLPLAVAALRDEYSEVWAKPHRSTASQDPADEMLRRLQQMT